MAKHRIYDDQLFAHFVTFSCFHRRRLLDHDRAKKIVLGGLNSQLIRQNGRCVGYVIMPDHVHSVVWFPETKQLSHFMKQWKQRTSVELRKLFETRLTRYAELIANDPIWQRKYYAFHVNNHQKLEEKLTYMHMNPVRARLIETATDWQWSSTRWYEYRQSVGVPIQWVE